MKYPIYEMSFYEMSQCPLNKVLKICTVWKSGRLNSVAEADGGGRGFPPSLGNTLGKFCQ